MFPVVADAGTGTATLVSVQKVGAAKAPLNVTALIPCETPKLLPVRVTTVPDDPMDGLRFVRIGPCRMVKAAPLLGMPATVTTMFPVVAPTGTVTTMLVSLQAVGRAAVPLKLTILVPGVVP